MQATLIQYGNELQLDKRIEQFLSVGQALVGSHILDNAKKLRTTYSGRAVSESHRSSLFRDLILTGSIATIRRIAKSIYPVLPINSYIEATNRRLFTMRVVFIGNRTPNPAKKSSCATLCPEPRFNTTRECAII